jgi:N4-gp56 family major capsid protein
MALTINSPSARRVWSMDLSRVVPQVSFFYDNQFIKPEGSNDAVIHEMMELAGRSENGKASGYEITFDLDGPLQGYTTPGDKVIKGKEKNLSLYTDRIQINQERFSVASEGKFSDQLVPYAFRERARDRMADYWGRFFDERMIVKLSGALGTGTFTTIDTSQSTASARNVDGSVASDGNDLRAPSTNRWILGTAGSAASGADGADLTSSMGMSLDVIDEALLLAVRTDSNATNLRLLPHLTINGRPTYVLLMDYVQARDLAASMSGRWYDIEKAKIQGGKSNSGLINGSLGIYRSPVGVDVILYAHPRMVKFAVGSSLNSGTTTVKAARALLMGSRAANIAYGRETTKLPRFSWAEETDDRGNQIVVTAGTVVGIQKTAFSTVENVSSPTASQREDWATIAVDTYVSQ